MNQNQNQNQTQQNQQNQQNVPASPQISANPTLQSNFPRPSGVVSMNENSVSINFPRIDSNNNLNTENPSTFELVHRGLYQCGHHLSRITGNQVHTVGPEVPTLPASRNSLGLLGSFLGNLHGQ